ncbi:MAG: 4Fe-4S dicluster domain-containing protein [Candidatus Hermodarchaeota archaeon]
MNENDYYEQVRKKLVLGPLYAPKHKKIYELMKIFWNEEEIKILSYFKPADQSNSLRELEQKLGYSRQEIKDKLRNALRKGTISRIGTKYSLLPILPGIFEQYFIRRRDTEENLIEAAKIYRFIFKNYSPSFYSESNFKLFRPRLPLNSEEKLVDVNQSFDIEQKILSYELVEELIEKNEIFSVVPCQCRLIGEYAGEPCSIAPPELGCLATGSVAEIAIRGGAPKMNKEEAIEFLKRTEKAGLIHSCVADTSNESSLYICNCCTCHCGVIIHAKQHKNIALYPSNYIPKWNHDICTKCDLCLNKCQMGAIYHKWANESDNSDEYMFLKQEFCVGCGVCANVCPNNAINLVKIREDVPEEKYKIGNKTFLELFI